jgi:hypothetical protein
MFVTSFSFFCHLELCESLASTLFGAPPIPSATTSTLDPYVHLLSHGLLVMVENFLVFIILISLRTSLSMFESEYATELNLEQNVSFDFIFFC